MNYKQNLNKNFSENAHYYDTHSFIQGLTAAELIRSIEHINFRNIIDLGCGTGKYTLCLSDIFPEASIQAVDFSNPMINIAKSKPAARNIKFCQYDAEFLNKNKEFDLVTSNAFIHWIKDIENMLVNIKKMLKENGIVHFSAFGPRTFYELKESLSLLLKKDIRIASSDFHEYNFLEGILNRHFSKIILRRQEYFASFNSIKQLIENIKKTGTRGARSIFQGLCTSEKLAKLEQIYLNNFKSIKATYEVFYCSAHD